MASIVELSEPVTEPVDLDTAKQFLRLPLTAGADDSLIETVLIPGARQQLENAIGLCLATRDFVQYEDGFPFFPYFQSPYAPLFGAAFPFYFGYGPIASYPYPAIGGLQNQMLSPFMKKLLRSPVTAFQKIEYIATDGTIKTLLPAQDFIVDFTSQPGRVMPIPGQRWPVGVNNVNTVRLYYSAGYGVPSAVNSNEQLDIDNSAVVPTPPNQFADIKFNIAIPPDLRVAILQMIVHWYQNRDVIVSTAGAGGQHIPLPWHMQQVIDSYRVWDFGPIGS